MRTYVEKAKEETGKCPPCTGALLEIKSIKRGEVKSQESEWVGCAQYTVLFEVKAPKAAAGAIVSDRIRVGTHEDKEAQKPSTWDVQTGGPARINRLLKRAGSPVANDDEEWMTDAVGHQVVSPIMHRGDFVNLGLFYRESDKDCPVIGLLDGAKPAAAKRRAVAVAEEEGVEDEEESGAEVEEEEEPPKKVKVKAKKPEPEEEEEEEEEAEEPPPKKVAAKVTKIAKQKAVEEEDEEE